MIATNTETDFVKLIEYLAARINSACEDGDTVSSIAKRAGVTRELVSQINNGSYVAADGKQRSPGLDNVLAIGEAQAKH